MIHGDGVGLWSIPGGPGGAQELFPVLYSGDPVV